MRLVRAFQLVEPVNGDSMVKVRQCWRHKLHKRRGAAAAGLSSVS